MKSKKTENKSKKLDAFSKKRTRKPNESKVVKATASELTDAEIFDIVDNDIDADEILPKRKGNTYETTKKVELIIDSLIAGKKIIEIIQLYLPLWKISERQFYNYLKKAYAKLDNISEKKIVRNFGIALSRLNNMYINTVMQADYKTALMVQKEINDLLGIKKPAKSEVITKQVIEFVETDENIVIPDDKQNSD